MLLTIILSISALVAINFFLLKYSSNKVNKTPKINKKPIVFKQHVALEHEPKMLAPTGS